MLKPKIQDPSKNTEDAKQKKTSSTQKGKNVRFSDELYEAAEAMADAAHRSAQKQLEYWARLGRLADQMLSNPQAASLLSNESFISEIAICKNTTPIVEDVLAEIEQDRASGSLKAKVTNASVVYDVAEGNESIRRIDANGKVTIGTLVNGDFVPRSDQ